MRLDWNLGGDYGGAGDEGALRAMVEEAIAALPREHVRQLGHISVLDDDPKGVSLGIWRQDHAGAAIEIYLRPHVAPLLGLPPAVRGFALRLHLAYTIFHEVGHHVTRVLNRRAVPPRKAARVDEKIERWADDYAEKRLARLAARWLQPGGAADAPAERRALSQALRALRLETVVGLDDAASASTAAPASAPGGTKATGAAS